MHESTLSEGVWSPPQQNRLEKRGFCKKLAQVANQRNEKVQQRTCVRNFKESTQSCQDFSVSTILRSDVLLTSFSSVGNKNLVFRTSVPSKTKNRPQKRVQREKLALEHSGEGLGHVHASRISIRLNMVNL